VAENWNGFAFEIRLHFGLQFVELNKIEWSNNMNVKDMIEARYEVIMTEVMRDVPLWLAYPDEHHSHLSLFVRRK
jgi:hypothetical protein